jgi:hypothetical protein
MTKITQHNPIDLSRSLLDICVDICKKCESPTFSMKLALRAVKSVWRKFMIAHGLLIERRLSSLSGDDIIKFRKTKRAQSRHYYSIHRAEILAASQKKRDLLKQEKENGP